MLEREGASAESASGVAAGTVQVSEKLSSHLGRVVGHLGMSALFVRSLFVTRARYPWLVGDPHRGPDERWQSLRACLEAQTAEAAREASLCLMTHILRLLGGLIGDTLVLRLLAEVWPDEVLTSTTEETP
ncbi:MAG: hypothetical protein Q8S73_14965 [Deltaproteobacteria bacterium]|nr:hypothetical protein [Myxococcales bacterium]MDP3215407.1 hypothetical protein [Deltaproteobacteria bacterium]